jgi:hypothetical protein
LSAHSLTIIVDLDIHALAQCREDIAGEGNCVFIGTDLSGYLIAQDKANTSQVIYKWLDDTLRANAPVPVICADIDILFYPDFHLDPLALFRQISRHTKLIVLWAGSYKDGVLSYAQPEHLHYRFWKNLDGIEIKGVNDAL